MAASKICYPFTAYHYTILILQKIPPRCGYCHIPHLGQPMVSMNFRSFTMSVGV